MSRKPIPREVETAVVLACARRCALCFGLHGDLRQKSGQIAHVDQDSSNADQDNLVFLCLDHHNEYDSVPRQTKGITSEELREYRKRLLAAIASGRHHAQTAAASSGPAVDLPEPRGVDIGVEVGAGLTVGFHPNRTVFSIAVQNRSGARFYLANVGFELSNGHVLMPLADIQGQPQAGAVIEAGDGHTLAFPAAELTETAKRARSTFRRAWARDKVGRIFFSSETLTSMAVENAQKFMEMAP